MDKFWPNTEKVEQEYFTALYLLHEFIVYYADWVTGTWIQRWAEEKELCVVVSGGDNSFYLDNKKSHNLYGEFMVQ